MDGIFVHDWKNRNHVHHDNRPPVQQANEDDKKSAEGGQSAIVPSLNNEEDLEIESRKLMRKLRIQVSSLFPSTLFSNLIQP